MASLSVTSKVKVRPICAFGDCCYGRALTPQLNSGHSIPVIALGVYQARPEDCYNAVLTALEAGCRHIDSAAWYGNEADVGRAVTKWLKDTGNKREDVPSRNSVH